LTVTGIDGPAFAAAQEHVRRSLPLTLLIEVPLFVAGVWLYARCTTPADA
jgi:hypothetical protein